MFPYHWTAYILLVLFCSTYSDAANLTQCLADVTSCATDPFGRDCVSSINISNTTAISLLRTSRGASILDLSSSLDVITALSYTGCVDYCGPSQEAFNWTVFSQEYAAWLLPYLALLSQLPFGARRRTDNLMSAILTLGSPVLAGYSMYMTLLNARWVNNYLFAGIDYPNQVVHQSVVRVLTSLQQVPLRIHRDGSARFESLVVHPDNDDWWTTLAEELEYSHTWSIASATSITWVVIAYLLTAADSLFNVEDHINSNGQGTGSVWLWLLPIVVGWLILSPKCDYMRVHDAFNKANRRVFVADPYDPTAPPTQITTNFGLTIHPSPDWKSRDRNVISPDESRIPPIFNYARALPWSRAVYITSLYYRAAWRKANHRVGVDGITISHDVHSDIPRESRLGNRGQIIRYCQPDDQEYPGPDIFWPRGVIFNMIVASLMSLQLQWGTTTAAILVVWFTPTIGFGCRSLAYLIYGMLSTIVWMLLVLSSILGYYAHHLIDDLPSMDLESNGLQTPVILPEHPEPILTSSFKRSRSRLSEGAEGDAVSLQEIRIPSIGADRDAQGSLLDEDSAEPPSIVTAKYLNAGRIRSRTIVRIADWLRWIGKFLVIVNGIGVIATSVFQYAGVFDNCYCDSSVFTWGISAFNVIKPIASDIHLATSAWIGALALALTSCVFFIGTIYLMRDSLPS